MSQRFGRNQRRRAREQIAALQVAKANLERAHVLDRALLQHTTQKLNIVRDELANAKETACRMSILFPAKEELHVGQKSDDRFPLKAYRPQMENPFISNRAIEAVMVQDLTLEALIAKVDKDAITGSLHFHVRFGDGEWAYALTRQAWASLNERMRVECIHRELASDLARLIAKHNLR